MAKGDHLMISFGTYQHHAIDMGDGKVIQYGGGDLTANDNEVAIVLHESLAAKGIINVVDQPTEFGADQIIQRALGRIGEKNYSLFGNNCEHFVNWCRTGKASSRQVSRAVERLASCAFKLSSRKTAKLVSQRVASMTTRRIAKSSLPWFLLADAAQLGAEVAASNRGMNQANAEKLGMATGLGASVGIGTIAAGPLGAVAGAGIWALGEAAGRSLTAKTS